MATLLKVLNNLADIKSAGGVALRVRTQEVRGLDKVRAAFVFGVAAYNLVRLPKLLASTGQVCPTA